jgi:hypothetical protein
MGRLSGKRGPDAGSPNARNAGAPRKKLDLVVMRRAASIGCNAEEIAALLGIGRATFYTHLERDASLQEDLERAADSGKATLRRMQWQRAAAGSDTMLIWLGKNMLNQTDRQQLTGAGGGPLMIVTGVLRDSDNETATATLEIQGEAEAVDEPYTIGTYSPPADPAD